MTHPAQLHPAVPIAQPLATSAAGMLFNAAIQSGTTATGALVVEAVRGARRLSVSNEALGLVGSLSDDRWATALAGARLQTGSRALWVEATTPLPFDAPAGTASGVGVLLLPRHDTAPRVTMNVIQAWTDGADYNFNVAPADELMPTVRGVLEHDLAVAAVLFLGGILVGVPPLNCWGPHAELEHIVVPVGYGVA